MTTGEKMLLIAAWAAEVVAAAEEGALTRP